MLATARKPARERGKGWKGEDKPVRLQMRAQEDGKKEREEVLLLRRRSPRIGSYEGERSR